MPKNQILCIVCNEEIPENSYDKGDPKICEKCWKCPDCGVGVDYRDDEGRISNGLILEEGYVNCYSCEGGWTVKEYEKAILKANKVKLTKCPHCKGQGWITEKCQSSENSPKSV